MEINNHNDLKEAADQAGALLQQIHNYCEENNLAWKKVDEAKIRFPRGFIRTAGAQRQRLPFLRSQDLKSNIAYTLILSDTILWLFLRTDLWGTPKEMLIKTYAFIIGSLCESITKDFLRGVCGGNYKKRTEFLSDHEIINEELKLDLDWLWDTRNNMHLFQLSSREYQNEYNDDCHIRCLKAFRGLLTALAIGDRLRFSNF